MTPLGEQLRTGRERRGATLTQVSDATRIKETYLNALERHDWQTLPAEVFTRGYIRTYAEHLGLHPDHLLDAYARERRIAGVGGPAVAHPEKDAARAFLENLAKTRGIHARRFGARSRWIALSLSGSGVAACAVWSVLHLLTPGTTKTQMAPVSSPSPAAEQVAEIVPPAPPAPEPQDASHLKIPEFGVGTAVVQHRLVGRGDRFREGTTVWFWTSVSGGRAGDKVRHVWLHDGRSIAEADLAVRGAQWRTQSRRPLPMGATGDWKVEARDPEGRVIASAAFTCVAAN